jgi:hypothetical protein
MVQGEVAPEPNAQNVPICPRSSRIMVRTPSVIESGARSFAPRPPSRR